MRPDEIREHGTALLERVRAQVDTEERLGLIVRDVRRRRVMRVALAGATAVAVIAVLVSITLFIAIEKSPVVTELETTTTTTLVELDSLPVEMYLTLASYTVDEATGQCSGTGELSGVIEGSRVSVVDDLSGEEVESVVLAAGTEITRDTDPAFLFPTGQDALCLFIDGLRVDHFDFSLVPESKPDVGVSGNRTGQRVVVVFDS